MLCSPRLSPDPLQGLPVPVPFPPLPIQTSTSTARNPSTPSTDLGIALSEGSESDTETTSDNDSLFEYGERDDEDGDTDSAPPPSPQLAQLVFLPVWDLGHLFQGDVEPEGGSDSDDGDNLSPLWLPSALEDALNTGSEPFTEGLGVGYQEASTL